MRIIDDLSNGHREYIPETADLAETDLCNLKLLDEYVGATDVCFHEAALPSVERSVENPIDCHEINTDATLEILESARRHDTRIVTASSAAIYGIPENLPLTETAPKEPTSPYGIDKLTIDHYTQRYQDLYGLDSVALRYFNIYGPRQTDSAFADIIPISLEQARNVPATTNEPRSARPASHRWLPEMVEHPLRRP